MLYQFYRPTSGADLLIKEVYPTGSQSPEAMGADVVDMAFELPEYVDFRINDFCMVYGKKYKINRTPTVTKEGNRHYIYKVQLEAYWYDLAKASYQFPNQANDLLEQDFSLMGNALTFVTLAVQNANRQSLGWTVGVVDDTDYKNLPFNKQNCLQVLHQLAQVFETELWIDNQVIHLTKREVSSGYTFEYGKGKGLNSVTRQNKTDINIFTRLYVRGGSTNLPTGYGSDALLMPGGDYFIEDPAKVALYGFAEDNEEFTDIFPKREGTVTGVTAGDENWMYLFDTALDFDINAQASPVGDAKISFITGQLAGYTFTIGNYNHATKRITINKNTEETNLDIPSNTLRPAIGDKYVLIDIIMPATYVTAAEQLLADTAQIHYDKGSDPKFQLAYSAVTDTLFMKANNIEVVLGTTAILLDAQIGINSELRIAKYTRDLQNPDLYTNIVWSDTIGANEIIRQYQQQKRTLQLLESSGLLDINQLRKNIFLNRLSESEGYLYLAGQKIKAGLADLATNALHANLADYALDADKWDGRDFSDYLDQPVRISDSPKFEGLSSNAFTSGAFGSGYRLSKTGGKYNLELDNLYIRGGFTATELIINKIRATNGALAVTDSAVVKSVFAYNATSYSLTLEGDIVFQVNDILKCQVFSGTSIKSYYLKVNTITSTPSITVILLQGTGISVGDIIVRIGSTSEVNRQGLLYLTSSDSGAPYLDVLDGVNSTDLTGKTKVRLGKLNGIVDADLGALSGYGLYGQNVYVKGKVYVTGGNAQTIAGSQALATNAKNEAITSATTQAEAIAIVKANAAQSAAITAAAADATAKANAAQSNASTDAQTKATAAQTAAQNYATAQSAYEREIAKAYADGIVSTEELARIADVSAKLQLAKDDATAKVTAVQAVVNGYTDTKALATLSSAQSYADASATSKANVAEANAVSLASSDAQTKANAAQANAAVLSLQLVDGVKIGGRNYYKYTTPYAEYSVITERTGNMLNITGTQGNLGTLVLQDLISSDGDWSVSFWAKTNSDFSLSAYVANAEEHIFDITTEWQYFKFTSFANTANGLYKTVTLYKIAWRLLEIKDLKLEKGNKATDWTPAPEDVQDAIDTANALAQTAQNNYNALTASLKSLAYQELSDLAIGGQTLIQGGKINTVLLDANAVRVNIVNAGYINTLELSASIITSGTIDSARINASQVLINAGGATTAQVATAKTEAITSATTQAEADATAKASAAQSAAISAAAADATAKANTAQGNASADAQAKATAAQTAAQTYATAQSAYEREIAKAYADGIVSAEELARIADVSAKLQLAKDDATAKVTAVQAVVNGYTDTKALATLSSAQSYADASATSKANVAEANAVSLASSDAQTKANAAQANAAVLSLQLVDGVKIGGRNYYKYTTPYAEYSVITERTGNMLNITGTQGNLGTLVLQDLISSDGDWSVSFWAKTNSDFSLSAYVANAEEHIFDITTEWQYFKFTSFANTANGLYKNVVLYKIAWRLLEIKDLKIEKGNKATDWTPAPEDVQDAIDTANALAQTAQNNYTALTASLKSMAYQDVVELSKLGSTLIEGGKIKTTLLDADYIKANIVNADYINALDITVDHIEAETGWVGPYIISDGSLVNEMFLNHPSFQYQIKMKGSNVAPFVEISQVITLTSAPSEVSIIRIDKNGLTMGSGVARIKGLVNGVKVIAGSYYTTKDDNFVLVTSAGTIYLPYTVEEGRMVSIAKTGSFEVTISGNGNSLKVRDATTTTTTLPWAQQYIFINGFWRVYGFMS